MKNWTELDFENENHIMVWDFYDRLWGFVNKNLAFQPYADDKDKVVTPPAPSKCFDVSFFLNGGYKQELYDNLELVMIEWFKSVSNGKRMYALDWQHVTYSFDPFLPFEKNQFDEWYIPAFPNGDLLCFLNEALTDGIFGDGYNFRIFIWGEKMIEVFNKLQPEILLKAKLVYKN